MASSIFGNQGGNSILSTMSQLRQAAGGNMQAACNLLDRAGITRTLPNGQQVSASQFASMMQNKTPEQAFGDMGIDYSQIQSFFR